MIAWLRGVLRESVEGRVVLDVSGVGYLLSVPATTFVELPAAGETAELHVSLQAREDSLTLYGFATTAERDVFERLISASGIGPRIALSALSALGAAAVVEAIRGSDVRALSSVPGIGRKTAERVIIELRDRVEGLALVAGARAPGPATRASDVVSALVNLGYADRQARAAVDQATEAGDTQAGFEELLRAALRALGRG